VEAAVQAGHPRNYDFNGDQQEGFGFFRVTQRNGRRHSAADAFLRAEPRRENLVVRTGALVTNLTFDGTHARGVRYWSEGKAGEASANREVILTAGAVNSPQLLMLSGIGPAQHLNSMGIKPLLDLPGVGQNLQDHPVVAVCYRSKRPVSLANATSPLSILRYVLFKQGPLVSNVAECGGFVHTREGLDRPDIQFHFAPAYYLEHGLRQVSGHGFTYGPTLMRPESRGWIRLRSSNPADPPRIQPNYLEAGNDRLALLEGLRIGRRIVACRAMDEFRGEEYCPGSQVSTDEDLMAYIRRTTETLYHPVGTCKMGADQMAVVDPQLRVHGIEGLRVADASIMPEIVTGNTNAPTYLIAEMAAAMMAKPGTVTNYPYFPGGSGVTTGVLK
jgi:choline dehydrogenase